MIIYARKKGTLLFVGVVIKRDELNSATYLDTVEMVIRVRPGEEPRLLSLDADGTHEEKHFHATTSVLMEVPDEVKEATDAPRS